MPTAPPLSKQPLTFTFSEVIDRTLADGTALYVIPKADEVIVTFGLYFRCGASHDTVPGATAFATEMLTRGTSVRGSEEFSEAVESMGSSIRASCDRDISSINAVCLQEYFTETLALATEALFKPSFDRDELDTLRERCITDALIDEKDPDWLATQASNRLCYAGHPYERRRRGTIADMHALMPDQLRAAHERMLRSPRCIIVAGPVDADAVLEMMNGVLAGLPTPTFDSSLPDAVVHEHAGCLAVNAEAVQTAFRISLPCAPFTANVYPAIQLITGTLGGYTLARLFAALREQKGYTYGAYAINSVRPYARSTDIITSVGNEFTADTLDTIAYEVKRIATERIPDDELENTRQQILGTFARSTETPQQTAGMLWTTLLYGLPRDYFPKLVSKLQKITPNDLVDVQREYFDISRWSVGASGVVDIVLPAMKNHVADIEVMNIQTADA